jgi:dienelactone hydrolase
MSCPSCFTGTIHEGTPKGSTTVLHGRKTYVADPPTSLAPKPIVVIISDAFGWNLVNTRVMADDIARKSGFQVLVPDFMDGASQQRP